MTHPYPSHIVVRLVDIIKDDTNHPGLNKNLIAGLCEKHGIEEDLFYQQLNGHPGIDYNVINHC
jgi:hypothetical protein